jgi:hypothetical protein
MSDIADNADAATDAFMREAFANIKPSQIPDGVGFCLNCGAGVEGNKRWCDKDCLDDWQQAQRAHNHRR